MAEMIPISLLPMGVKFKIGQAPENFTEGKEYSVYGSFVEKEESDSDGAYYTIWLIMVDDEEEIGVVDSGLCVRQTSATFGKN